MWCETNETPRRCPRITCCLAHLRRGIDTLTLPRCRCGSLICTPNVYISWKVAIVLLYMAVYLAFCFCFDGTAVGVVLLTRLLLNCCGASAETCPC